MVYSAVISCTLFIISSIIRLNRAELRLSLCLISADTVRFKVLLLLISISLGVILVYFGDDSPTRPPRDAKSFFKSRRISASRTLSKACLRSTKHKNSGLLNSIVFSISCLSIYIASMIDLLRQTLSFLVLRQFLFYLSC